MTTTVFTRARWAAGFATVLTGIAMLVYPGGTALDPSSRGYSFFQNFFSDLGSTVAYDGRPNSLGSSLFAVSLGILVLAFGGCLAAFVKLYSGSPVSRFLARAAGVTAVLVCVSFIGVALTPENRFIALHVQFTRLAFRAFPLVALLLTLATARNHSIPRRAAVGWVVLTIVLVGYVAVMDWGPRLTTERGLTIQVAAQKIVAVAAVVILVYQCYEADRVGARLEQAAT